VEPYPKTWIKTGVGRCRDRMESMELTHPTLSPFFNSGGGISHHKTAELP
jgi:hypothetical protein